MALPPSVLLADPNVPASAGDARTFRVNGDLDDPLRLTVLLGEHLGKLVPSGKEAADTCLSPRSTWRARKDALSELLRLTRNQGAWYAILVDPDALAQPVSRGWEDRAAHRMREDFKGVLFEAIDRGGWLVSRPWPTPIVDAALDAVAPDLDDSAPMLNANPQLARFAPDVRPIVSWLMKKRHFSAERVEDLLEEVRDPNAYVVAMAHDALPHTARRAARTISTVRTPCKVNGAFGPLTWAVDEVPDASVRRADVETLQEAGFLTCDDSREPESWVMPRRVRRHVAVFAKALEPERLDAVHRRLARDTALEDRPVEAQIEVHYHAARSGDEELATRTARYFGFELRALATEKSREKKDYAGAARLFRHLVETFDETDAYAWEYLAYNLARAHGDSEEVLCAYERAHELDKNNPLYLGRFLGQQARMGRTVKGTFDRAMQRYASAGDVADYVSWFVMPVFDGLRAQGRLKERDELARNWRGLLERYAPKVLEKHLPGST